ncbi:MAG: AsmA family protein [Proteobacteria bacterium]|nr:AsmA family protein [Pseudomonadota bacterium]
MRAAKWILIIVGLLVALVVAGIVVLTVFVDPNRFKADIADAVGRETGRELRLEGDIELSFFPWLALTTGQGSLGNPPGFAAVPFVSWREARLRVRLLPLLRGRAVLDTVKIVGADFRLLRRADGTANWEGWGPAPAASGDIAAPAGMVAGLELEDGRLQFQDDVAARLVQLDDWQLAVGAIRPGEPIDLETAFHATTVGLPAARLRIVGRYVPRDTATVLENFRLDGTLAGAPLAVPEIPLELAIPSARLLTANNEIDIPEWRVQLGLFVAKGSLQATMQQALSWSGELALTSSALREGLAQWGIAAPATRDPAVLGPLELKTQWRYALATLAAQPLSLVLDDTSLSGKLTVTLANQPLSEFELQGDRIQLERYLPPEDATSEPFVLPTAALRALQVRGTLGFDAATLEQTRMQRVRIGLLLDEQGAHAN